MNTKYRILILIFSVALCCNSIEGMAQINYSIKASKQEDTIKRKTKGINYTLKSEIKYKTDGSSNGNDFQFKNKISFHGMGSTINKVIKKSDFEKKIDLKKIESFDIKQINFSVNENRDEIYLKYLLTLDNREETVVLTLKNDGLGWNLI